MTTSPLEGMPIRPASADDAPAIAGLLGELGYPADPREIPDRLSRMRRDGAAAAFVACAALADGEQVTGLVTVHERIVLHSADPVAQLTALVVGAAFRGAGIGARLVAAAEGWARARGATRMVVTTALHRADASQFYERLGYEHTGRRYARAL